MIRGYIRALASMQADLEVRPRAEHLSRAARLLFDFYDEERRLQDVLTRAEDPPKTKPAYPRGRDRKRNRPRKPKSSDYALAILREVIEPIPAEQVWERLMAEFKPIQRKSVYLVLAKLKREGKAERVKAEHGVERDLWRSVD